MSRPRLGSKEVREVAKEFAPLGWTASPTPGGHIKFEHESGPIYFTASSPSDQRGPQKLRKDLRKLTPQEEQVGDTTPTTIAEAVGKPEPEQSVFEREKAQKRRRHGRESGHADKLRRVFRENAGRVLPAEELVVETGLGFKQVRSSASHLVATKEIERVGTGKWKLAERKAETPTPKKVDELVGVGGSLFERIDLEGKQLLRGDDGSLWIAEKLT